MRYHRSVCCLFFSAAVAAHALAQKIAPISSPVAIDYVMYYEETNEVTVELFYLNDYTEEAGNKLKQAAQQVVYDQNEVKRTRIPATIAKTYLDLSGLDKINLFDGQGHFITKAQFVGVDYYEDLISGSMVAAFKLEQALDQQPVFFISASHHLDPGIPTVLPPGKNRRLIDYLVAETGADTTDQWGFHVMQFQQAVSETYTLMSASNAAYIYATFNEDIFPVYQADETVILDGVVLDIQFNNKPLILLRQGKPETDWIWSNLLYYDGAVYQSATHNRMTLPGR